MKSNPMRDGRGPLNRKMSSRATVAKASGGFTTDIYAVPLRPKRMPANTATHMARPVKIPMLSRNTSSTRMKMLKKSVCKITTPAFVNPFLEVWDGGRLAVGEAITSPLLPLLLPHQQSHQEHLAPNYSSIRAHFLTLLEML